MRVSERIIEDFITTASTEVKLLGEVPNDRLYDEYIISKCGPRPKLEREPEPDLSLKHNQKLFMAYQQELEKYGKCESPERLILQIDAQNK